MIKKLITLGLSLFTFIATMTPIYAVDNSASVDISGEYGIVIDQDNGQILYNKKAKEKMYPASITKILTCIVALEMVDDLDKQVTITDSDVETVWETGASAANFTPGEVVTYRDVFMGAMLPSGADACRALANNTCGSQEKFVDKMNDLVKKLGLKDSHFVNTTGIHDPNHYTTAYDMAKITQYALQNEKFVEIFTRYQYNASNGLHQWVKKVLYTCKRDHMNVSMIEGCKSGYTSDAQHTLSSMINVNNHHYICVVGYSKNKDGYNHCTVNDTITLGNYVGSHYKEVNLLQSGNEVTKSSVSDGEKNKVAIKIDQDINIVLPNDYNEKDIEYKQKVKTFTAPVKKDQNAGKLDVYYKENKLGSYTLSTVNNVAESESVIMFRKIKNILIPCVITVFICIVVLLIIRQFIIKRRRRRRRRR